MSDIPAPARYGTVLLRGIVGSTAYGLAHADSDQDRLGTYAAPTRAVLGLAGHQEVTRSQVTHEPDQSLHEVGKFAALAAKSNPTVTELLWLDSYEVHTPSGQALIDIRTAFLTTPDVRGAYGGYALQQAHRLQQRSETGAVGFSSNIAKRTAKHGRHCLRLLRQGQHLLATGELMVNVAHLREELFAAGELATTDPDGFHELFRREMATFDSIKSELPDTVATAVIDDVLVQIRRDHLN